MTLRRIKSCLFIYILLFSVSAVATEKISGAFGIEFGDKYSNSYGGECTSITGPTSCNVLNVPKPYHLFDLYMVLLDDKGTIDTIAATSTINVSLHECKESAIGVMRIISKRYDVRFHELPEKYIDKYLSLTGWAAATDDTVVAVQCNLVYFQSSLFEPKDYNLQINYAYMKTDDSGL